jgi:hypothetical protein
VTQRVRSRSAGRNLKSFNQIHIVVSRPRAMTCSVIIPASRLPRSLSDRVSPVHVEMDGEIICV